MIRLAQQSGQFENLPGFGKPIPGIDEELDENWWIRDKLRREQINALPPILQARLELFLFFLDALLPVLFDPACMYLT